MVSTYTIRIAFFNFDTLRDYDGIMSFINCVLIRCSKSHGNVKAKQFHIK